MDERTVFMAALEYETPEQRAAYLDTACRDAAALRGRVEVLLRIHDTQHTLLDGGRSKIAATLDQSAVEQPGTMIGPYKLIEEIGEGGMGSVFMALQKEPVRREVALKVIKPGMDSKQVVRRFEAERQALAIMDHPNIAHVFDGGTTESGRPYFVMELVKGVLITDYADQHKLSTNDRLGLFGDVCCAVQHAHQKGIIHRDLKPSNILVTLLDEKATPKVIDFGIAKATSGQLMDGSMVTAYSQLVGTPMYMSPEQAEPSAVDVDTRSDVYSLGVLLYELLTGTTPFDRERMSSVSFDEFRRIVREEDPPRPSTRLSTLDAALDTVAEKHRTNPRTLSQQVSGELDWIVMKALEKDRTRRYGSAIELAKDVQRYLDDEPVEACPPSVLYKVRKYARRHTALLVTGSLLAVTLLLATCVSAFYAIQADRQRQTAEEEKAKAVAAEQLADKRSQQSRRDFERALESLDTIVQKLASVELTQIPGMDHVRDDMLEKALTFYEAIIREHDNDAYARQQHALAYGRISEIQGWIGRHEACLQANNAAVTIFEQLAKEEPANFEYQWQLADTLFDRMHNINRGKSEQLADAERALRIVERLRESGQVNNENISYVALFYFKVAERLPIDSSRATELLEKSIRLTDRHNLAPLAPVLIHLGRQAERADDFQTAERQYRRGIALYEKEGQDLNRQDRYVQQWLASQECGHLAEMLAQCNRPQDAEATYRHALDIARQLVHEYGSNAWFQKILKNRVSALVVFLEAHGRSGDAAEVLHALFAEFPDIEHLHTVNVDLLKQHEDARAKLEAAIDRFPQQNRYKCEYYGLLGRQAEQAGNSETAEQHYRRGLEFARQSFRKYEWPTLFTPCAWPLAKCLASQGRWDTASELIDELIAEFPDCIELHDVRAHLLELHEERLVKLQAAMDQFPRGRKFYAIKYYKNRGIDFQNRGEYERAREDLVKTLELSPGSVWIVGQLAEVHLSLRSYQEAVDALTPVLNGTDPKLWYLFKRRAVAWFHLGQFSRAVADLDLALTMKPDDLSSVTWIAPQQVAQCSDVSFQQAMLALAEKGVELNGGSSASRVARAAILLALGNKRLAQADFNAVARDDATDYGNLYLAALLATNYDQPEVYRLICRTMVKRFRDSQDPSELYFTVWSSVLASHAMDDMQPVLEMAEQLVAQTPNSQRCLQTQGAALYRAGKYDQALEALQHAETAPADANTPSLYTKYLLAMAHHQLKHADEARKILDSAVAQHDQEVTNEELTQGGRVLWNRKLTLDLLQEEAQSLIDGERNE